MKNRVYAVVAKQSDGKYTSRFFDESYVYCGPECVFFDDYLEAVKELSRRNGGHTEYVLLKMDIVEVVK